MTSPARVALLGYGLAGAAFHAPFIATTPGLRLTAIVTRNEERRAKALRDHPEVYVLDSAEDVWQSADEFELVVVAAPNRAHVSLARGALEAGLPVVVDKPLAPSAAEARELVEEARRRGLMLTAFHNRRWDGDFLTLRALLDEGSLGDIFRFESRFERWRPGIKSGWRELPGAEDAGGVLFDLGSHLVDQAFQLFGPSESVYAELDARREGARVDDDAFVAIQHVSGVHSHLWMSAVAAQQGPRFRVLGGRGAYTKYGLDVQEDALRAGRSPNEAGWGEEAEEHWGRLGVVDGDLREIPTLPGSYGAFYESVAGNLRDGTPPPVDASDAVAVLDVLEAARNSVST